MAREGNVSWGYTTKVGEFLNNNPPHPLHEETTMPSPALKEWQGRPLIHRDSRINKGVYLCAWDNQALGEACVVDDEKQPQLLTCYEELKNRIGQKQAETGLWPNEFAMDLALDLTQEIMPYNMPMADYVTKAYPPGTKIELGSYVEFHGGVCRHQALLTAYLLEKMIDEGILSGQVSVDRNIIPNKGGHAWVRYTASDGSVYILDPAQNFRGTLEQASNNAYWDYRRPEDIKPSLMDKMRQFGGTLKQKFNKPKGLTPQTA